MRKTVLILWIVWTILTMACACFALMFRGRLYIGTAALRRLLRIGKAQAEPQGLNTVSRRSLRICAARMYAMHADAHGQRKFSPDDNAQHMLLK